MQLETYRACHCLFTWSMATINNLLYQKKIVTSILCFFIQHHSFNFSSVCRFSNCMMTKRALVFLADGAEEMEFVITADVLVRGGVSLK